MSALLDMDGPELVAFCQRHGIRRLSVFGSRLHGDARPDSDPDLLVEFEPGSTPGYLGLSAIELALGERLGRKVDLRTAQDLSPHFRDRVVRDAWPAYEA